MVGWRTAAARILFRCQTTLRLRLGIGVQGDEVRWTALLGDERESGCHLVVGKVNAREVAEKVSVFPA